MSDSHPIDARFIRLAEKQLGRILPPNYLTWMCQENGGLIRHDGEVWALHSILDNTDLESLRRTCHHLVRDTRNCQRWPDFPKDSVAIGSGFGLINLNKLLFLPCADRFGDAVYSWGPG